MGNDNIYLQFTPVNCYRQLDELECARLFWTEQAAGYSTEQLTELETRLLQSQALSSVILDVVIEARIKKEGGTV